MQSEQEQKLKEEIEALQQRHEHFNNLFSSINGLDPQLKNLDIHYVNIDNNKQVEITTIQEFIRTYRDIKTILGNHYADIQQLNEQVQKHKEKIADLQKLVSTQQNQSEHVLQHGGNLMYYTLELRDFLTQYVIQDVNSLNPNFVGFVNAVIQNVCATAGYMVPGNLNIYDMSSCTSPVTPEFELVYSYSLLTGKRNKYGLAYDNYVAFYFVDVFGIVYEIQLISYASKQKLRQTLNPNDIAVDNKSIKFFEQICEDIHNSLPEPQQKCSQQLQKTIEKLFSLHSESFGIKCPQNDNKQQQQMLNFNLYQNAIITQWSNKDHFALIPQAYIGRDFYNFTNVENNMEQTNMEIQSTQALILNKYQQITEDNCKFVSIYEPHVTNIEAVCIQCENIAANDKILSFLKNKGLI